MKLHKETLTPNAVKMLKEDITILRNKYMKMSKELDEDTLNDLLLATFDIWSWLREQQPY